MSYFKFNTARQYSNPPQDQILYCYKERITDSYSELFDEYQYIVYFVDIDRSIVGMIKAWGDDVIDSILVKYDKGDYIQLSHSHSWITAIYSKCNLGV